MRSRWAAGLLACALVAGCSGDGGNGEVGTQDDAAATSTPVLVVPTPDDAAATSEGVPATAVPDEDATTAGPPPEPVDVAALISDEELLDQAQWVLDHLEPGTTGPDVVSIGQRFDQPFLDQVPALQLGLGIAQLRAAGPYVVTDAAQVDGLGRAASLRLHTPEQPLVMTISLDEEGLISGLLFVPDTSGEPPTVQTWADLDHALTELGGEAQVVVGEVRDGACTPVHTTPGHEPGGDPFPSGSVAKLIVLAGVVEAVQVGDLAWDQELTITEEVKSLPSGILQERETGSTVTVQEAAELMIAISDNTATDLLIGAVGQPHLRTAMEASGVDPLRVAPLTTTKQLFILGWGVDQEVRDRWARASVPEQRDALLADLPDDLSAVDVGAVTTPVWQDGADWLLTGGEICGAHAHLQQLAGSQAGAPVRDILSANPGGQVPEGAGYVAFKGGSVPGVLALTYYVEVGGPAGDGAATTAGPTATSAGPTATGTPGDDAASTATPDGPTGYVLSVQVRSADPVDQMRAGTIVEAGLQHLVDAAG